MSIVHSQPWRIVLFTDFEGAVGYHLVRDAIAQIGRIAGVVTTPGPKSRRSTDYFDTVAAIPAGIDTIVSNHPGRLATMVATMHPDFIVSAGYRWQLPDDLLAVPRIGAINLHPSLLPRHRGPHPIEWTFRSGDSQAGFSVHELAAGFDTGAILSQATFPVEDYDDANALVMRMFPVVPELIVDALERLARGERGDLQYPRNATYAGEFEPEWREIDWSQPARTIHNQVRSWTGMRGTEHGAIGEFDGVRHTITRTRLVSDLTPERLLPGEMLWSEGERVVVQCGDGLLEILAAEPVSAAAQQESVVR